jgi:prepilin-type N-terminal cleavage/methylation domain-containing protein
MKEVNYFPDMVYKNTSRRVLRGFTLIEILVVIAIIGILSGIILLNLNISKVKAKDARIINEMHQIRNLAGVYYDENYNFNGFGCIGDTLIICDDITNQGGINFVIAAKEQDYCAKVQLNGGYRWCVDSKGRSTRYDSSTTPTTPACDNTPGSEVYTCE